MWQLPRGRRRPCWRCSPPPPPKTAVVLPKKTCSFPEACLQEGYQHRLRVGTGAQVAAEELTPPPPPTPTISYGKTCSTYQLGLHVEGALMAAEKATLGIH